ncbi:hypothetical protein BZA70DRAFT_277762 [Myxozyma melibiosi]|uniref:Uncharacterized protein n=1 Tax=Myxozyma melibiosi TaxID=54550 RepID=A0ABR1F608_9ASCO
MSSSATRAACSLPSCLLSSSTSTQPSSLLSLLSLSASESESTSIPGAPTLTFFASLSRSNPLGARLKDTEEEVVVVVVEAPPVFSSVTFRDVVMSLYRSSLLATFVCSMPFLLSAFSIRPRFRFEICSGDCLFIFGCCFSDLYATGVDSFAPSWITGCGGGSGISRRAARLLLLFACFFAIALASTT